MNENNKETTSKPYGAFPSNTLVDIIPIRSITSISATVTTLAFILSIPYEFAYFYVAGFEFFNILGASDFLKNALFWLPFVFMGYPFGVIASGFFSPRRQEHQLSDEYIGVFDTAKKKTMPRLYRIFILLLSIIVPLYIFVFFHSLISLIFISIIPIIYYYVEYLFDKGLVSKLVDKHGIDQTERIMKIAITCFVSAGSIMTSAVIGRDNAYIDLRKYAPAYVVEYNDKKILTVILRVTEKGLLFRADEGVQFAPWDNIKSFRRPYIEKGSESWFSVFQRRLSNEPVPEP